MQQVVRDSKFWRPNCSSSFVRPSETVCACDLFPRDMQEKLGSVNVLII